MKQLIKTSLKVHWHSSRPGGIPGAQWEGTSEDQTSQNLEPWVWKLFLPPRSGPGWVFWSVLSDSDSTLLGANSLKGLVLLCIFTLSTTPFLSSSGCGLTITASSAHGRPFRTSQDMHFLHHSTVKLLKTPGPLRNTTGKYGINKSLWPLAGVDRTYPGSQEGENTGRV